MKTYDLVHIHPSATRQTPSFFYLPVGVFGLLNELRAAGYSVAAINEPLEMAMDPAFRLERLLGDCRALCYSIDIHWHEHLYGGVEVARAVKRLYPRSTVVAGGITASLFARELLACCPALDVVVAGYGEQQLLEIVRGAQKGRRWPQRLLTRLGSGGDLEAQDFVTDDFLFHAREYLQCSIHRWHPDRDATTFWLKNGQGCRGNCSFCGGTRAAQKRIFGNCRVVRRSPQRLAQDMVRLARRGVRRIALTQDVSQAGAAYWEPLHRLLRAARTSVALYLEASGLPSPAYIESFSRTFDVSRSALALTPLCAGEETRARNGKCFSNEQLWRCLLQLKEHRIHPVLYFSSHLPFEDPGEPQRQTEFIREIRAATDCQFVFRTPLTLDPGSPMQRYPQRYGISVTLPAFADYLNRCRLRSLGRPYDRFGYTLRRTRPRVTTHGKIRF